jgi:type II secretory pathway pseudopilin PulG
MIGVLAIIAIVAAILTPNLARRISRAQGEKEDQVLGVLAEGLIRAARANQSIPGQNTWVTNIAAQTGLPVAEVLYVNPAFTANSRVYLIHPSFTPTNAAGSDPLWTQTSAGATSVTNAKVMILSVHKPGLALPVSSGRASSVAAFDAIWNWNFDPATRAPPAGWPATWTGNGEYLHVQRINLLSEFNRVTFSNAHYPSLYPSAQFGSAASVTLNAAAAIDAWYFDGTYVRLYKDSGAGGALDLSHSIVAAMNFLYESNRWRVP